MYCKCTVHTACLIGFLPAGRVAQIKAELAASGSSVPGLGDIAGRCSSMWKPAKAPFVQAAAAQKAQLESYWWVRCLLAVTGFRQDSRKTRKPRARHLLPK